MPNPELLCPAGDMECLRTALRFGADAVYVGGPQLQLRSQNTGFSMEDLAVATKEAHALGHRLYVTVNAFPTNAELEALGDYAQGLFALGVDAAIVADLGAVAVMRRAAPGLAIHISTQANCLNYAAAAAWHDMGASRVVLAREMTLEQICQLRARTPAALELEAFVHGAMCMAWSGRCMISAYLTGRSANRGACTQSCRWRYALMEEKRPGEIIDAEEDEHGTSFFSSYDLNMIAHLPELAEAGVSSLKIEGRMKTPIYVASVVSVYRRAFDLLMDQGTEAYRAALPALEEELQKVSHRPYNTGFYFGRPRPEGGAGPVTQTMEYTSDAEGVSGGWLTVTVKNRFFPGDRVEVLTPDGVRPLTVREIRDAETGEILSAASPAGRRVRIPCGFSAGAGDFVRGVNRNHL